MYDVTRYYTLTSPAGAFEFTREVPLSHAKLVRDTMTAAVMGANALPAPKRSGNPMTWLRSHLDGPVKDTPFVWYPS